MTLTASSLSNPAAAARTPWIVVGCALAVLFGAAAAYVDAHNDEVQAAALVLLVGGFVLGAVLPRGRWVAGILLGLSILAAHVVARLLGLGPETARTPPRIDMLIPLVPSLLGTAVGVGAHYLVRRGVDALSR